MTLLSWDTEREPVLKSWDHQCGWRPWNSGWLVLPLPWAIPKEWRRMNLVFPFSQSDVKSKSFLWWGTLSWNATGLGQAWGMDSHSVEALGGGWSSESGDSRKLSTYLAWQVRESGHGWSVNVNLMVVTFPEHILSARSSIHMMSCSPSTCR